MTLIFTKVMDELSRGLIDKDEDAEAAPTDRAYWEKKGTKATVQLVDVLLGIAREIDPVLPKRWIIGVSSEGHAVMSVKVRPEPKDSGFEAREAPWRESKTAEPSDNMLERSMREASGCNVQ